MIVLACILSRGKLSGSADMSAKQSTSRNYCVRLEDGGVTPLFTEGGGMTPSYPLRETA